MGISLFAIVLQWMLPRLIEYIYTDLFCLRFCDFLLLFALGYTTASVMHYVCRLFILSNYHMLTIAHFHFTCFAVLTFKFLFICHTQLSNSEVMDLIVTLL